MRVYLVLYDDPLDETNKQVLQVYSTVEKANKYLNNLDDKNYYVVEYEVK